MFDMNPIITQYVKQVDTEIRDGCFRVAQKYAIDINEERLLQALTDARSFYDEGFNAGERAAMDRLVRCKDCKRMNIVGVGYRWCEVWERIQTMGDEGFCCFGERRAE